VPSTEESLSLVRSGYDLERLRSGDLDGEQLR
jgi:hypothetical protein